MPERTRARICLTCVSCHLNIRKTTAFPDLGDDMLGVSRTKQGQMNRISKGMSQSKVGQDFPDIFMNEIDADGDKPDQHCDGHAAKSSTKANEIVAMEVFKQFDMDQRSGNVKEMVAALNLAKFTDVAFHSKSTCPSFVSL